MVEEKKCPKCGRNEKMKNGFMREKQRHRCEYWGKEWLFGIYKAIRYS